MVFLGQISFPNVILIYHANINHFRFQFVQLNFRFRFQFWQLKFRIKVSSYYEKCRNAAV